MATGQETRPATRWLRPRARAPQELAFAIRLTFWPEKSWRTSHAQARLLVIGATNACQQPCLLRRLHLQQRLLRTPSVLRGSGPPFLGATKLTWDKSRSARRYAHPHLRPRTVLKIWRVQQMVKHFRDESRQGASRYHEQAPTCLQTAPPKHATHPSATAPPGCQRPFPPALGCAWEPETILSQKAVRVPAVTLRRWIAVMESPC